VTSITRMLALTGVRGIRGPVARVALNVSVRGTVASAARMLVLTGVRETRSSDARVAPDTDV
jgi:hypothetical protein